MRARALFFVAPRRVEIRPVEVPAIEDGEVLVRTLFSGISSGTELLLYRGMIDSHLSLDEGIGALGGTFEYPCSYGYSCVGRVERSLGLPEIGSIVFAFHAHQDLFRARTSDLLPLSGLSPRIATLFPSVETALQISLDAGDHSGELVLVYGLGAVGALTAALLARGGADVLAIEPRPWRREAAVALGIAACEPESLDQEIERRTAGRGAALAVEASGDPRVLADALPRLRHEGTALVASWYGTQPVVLPLGREFHRRRLMIRSTQVTSIPERLASKWTLERRRSAALALLEGGELPLETLATHEFGFEEASLAYAAMERGEEGLIHAALRYDDPG